MRQIQSLSSAKVCLGVAI